MSQFNFNGDHNNHEPNQQRQKQDYNNCIIESTSSISSSDASSASSNTTIAVLLLRKLHDVVINANGTRLFGYRSLLQNDPYFGKVFQQHNKTVNNNNKYIRYPEYYINENSDIVKQHMERVYFASATDTPSIDHVCYQMFDILSTVFFIFCAIYIK